MRIASILRTAAFAAALAATTGVVGAAFADDGSALDRHDQIKSQGSTSSPYDGPEFVLPLSQTFS
ncbi:MAG TPA: hypothetical protein VJR47_08050 [Stellaceae bacterium]|nr:hypothetical protein [Stellaceae bacterium]